MSEDYRGHDAEPGPSRWLRKRWKYGSVLVLDIDNIICTRDATRGLIIEWKHADAADKTWRLCRIIGRRLGWWSALFIYTTPPGAEPKLGYPTRIIAEFQSPTGKRSKPFELDPAGFDAWVCREFGAEEFRDAA